MPPDDAASSPRKRITTREIAAKAGVSNSTVSLALRNSPLIARETREKIQKLAQRLGYRPDPDVSRLMYHLRQRHKPRFKSVIVGLTTNVESDEQSYMLRLWGGARTRAEALGYGASLQRVRPAELRRGSILRTLRNRGVEGILLLPQQATLALENAPEWSNFSVVVATHAIATPEFHRVVPDQFGNTLLLCRKLAQHGCRRIGLLVWRHLDQRVGHRISGAVTWQNALGDTEPVAPLVYEDDFRPKLAAWFKRERPDAIVVGLEQEAHEIARLLGLSIPGRVVFAVTDGNEPQKLPGIDQRAGDVGAGSVSVLHGLMQSGERGIPSVPHLTMIQGAWNPGLLKRRVLA